jgi:hypothetical protein
VNGLGRPFSDQARSTLKVRLVNTPDAAQSSATRLIRVTWPREAKMLLTSLLCGLLGFVVAAAERVAGGLGASAILRHEGLDVEAADRTVDRVNEEGTGKEACQQRMGVPAATAEGQVAIGFGL